MSEYEYKNNHGLHKFEDDDEEENEEKDDEKGGGDFMMKKILETRTIVIARPVSDKLYEKVINMLMLLESADPEKPIKIFVNSPGGSADSGFAIYDAMRFVKCPIITITNGICASAAVIIFLGGDKDKRYSLPNARFLIHQPSTFAQGQATDLAITAQEIIKIREQYNSIVSEATGKTIEKITEDADRDFWLSAKEAVEYGLVTKVVTTQDEIE